MMRMGIAVRMAAALLLIAGCGSGKSTISGQVTLDGKALDNGTIQFFPVALDAPTAGAIIGKDGRYSAELSPTKFKVVMHVNKKVGERKLYEGQADSPTADINEELLPARYSDMAKSELTVDIVPGKNEKDFPLESGKKK